MPLFLEEKSWTALTRNHPQGCHMVGLYLRTQPPRRELHVSDRLLPQLLSWPMPHASTQLTIDQPVSYTILVDHQNCYLKIYPDLKNLWIKHQQPLKQKNGIFFKKKRFAKVQICKKSFDFLLVSCLWQLPRKKLKIVETMRHLETGIHGPGYLYTFAWCIRIWIYYTTMQRYNKTHTMTSILPLKHWHSTFDIWMIGLFCRIYSECLATQYIEVFIYFRIKCS